MSSLNLPGINYIWSALDWDGKKRFDLNNVRTVVERLGNPQDVPKTVHVAGTNGKGSTSAAIAAILGASGARVGLNTSPHLSCLNERVVIDGVPVSDQMLNQAALQVKKASEKEGVTLSFHELITVISFECFREVEWAVLEVGMGGRLDASNVIGCPEVAAIVSIDFDHERFLGNTLAKIAKEKAGIVKRGSVLVTGQLPDEALEVVRDIVKIMEAKQIEYGSDYIINNNINRLGCVGCDFRSEQLGNISYSPALAGVHQENNMAVAVAMAKVLGLSDQAIQVGIEGVFWPARLEWVEGKKRSILIDCAHNPAGIQSLATHLKANKLYNLSVGLGLLHRDNWQCLVDALLPFINEWHLLEPDSDRAVLAQELLAYLNSKGIKARNYGREYDRFIAEQANQESNRTLLLTGSIYLVGALRERLVSGWKPMWRRTVLRPATAITANEIS